MSSYASQSRAAEIADADQRDAGLEAWSNVQSDGESATVERVTTSEPCSIPTCEGIAAVTRGVLRLAGHPMDGRVVVAGARLCPDCLARRAAREAALAEQQKRDEAAAAQLRPATPKLTIPAPRDPLEVIPKDYRGGDWARVPEKHRRLLEDWPKDPDSLYLFGPPGRGKTVHVGLLVQAHLEIAPSHTVAWRNVSLMLARLRRSIGRPTLAESIIEDAIIADVLVLDDLGRERPSAWALEQLYILLEERTSHQRVTVITSNFAMSELRAHLLTSKDDDPGLPVAVDALISRIRGKHRVLTAYEGPDQRIHGAPREGTPT